MHLSASDAQALLQAGDQAGAQAILQHVAGLGPGPAINAPGVVPESPPTNPLTQQLGTNQSFGQSVNVPGLGLVPVEALGAILPFLQLQQQTNLGAAQIQQSGANAATSANATLGAAGISAQAGVQQSLISAQAQLQAIQGQIDRDVSLANAGDQNAAFRLEANLQQQAQISNQATRAAFTLQLLQSAGRTGLRDAFASRQFGRGLAGQPLFGSSLGGLTLDDLVKDVTAPGVSFQEAQGVNVAQGLPSGGGFDTSAFAPASVTGPDVSGLINTQPISFNFDQPSVDPNAPFGTTPGGNPFTADPVAGGQIPGLPPNTLPGQPGPLPPGTLDILGIPGLAGGGTINNRGNVGVAIPVGENGPEVAIVRPDGSVDIVPMALPGARHGGTLPAGGPAPTLPPLQRLVPLGTGLPAGGPAPQPSLGFNAAGRQGQAELAARRKQQRETPSFLDRRRQAAESTTQGATDIVAPGGIPAPTLDPGGDPQPGAFIDPVTGNVLQGDPFTQIFNDPALTLTRDPNAPGVEQPKPGIPGAGGQTPLQNIAQGGGLGGIDPGLPLASQLLGDSPTSLAQAQPQAIGSQGSTIATTQTGLDAINLPAFQQLTSGNLLAFGKPLQEINIPEEGIFGLPDPFQVADTFNQLPPQEQEDILVLYEKAGIRRQDFLANTLAALPGFRGAQGSAGQVVGASALRF